MEKLEVRTAGRFGEYYGRTAGNRFYRWNVLADYIEEVPIADWNQYRPVKRMNGVTRTAFEVRIRFARPIQRRQAYRENR